MIGGLEKHELRELILPILAKNRSFQRLLTDIELQDVLYE
jgi:hypothetical protein